MPEVQRYRVKVETRVTVESVALTGGALTVGEYTVRALAGGGVGRTHVPADIPEMVRVAMEKVTKNARVMAAGVDNTERSRLK